MRKYLVAAVLIAAFASPALAEEFYIGYDGKRYGICTANEASLSVSER